MQDNRVRIVEATEDDKLVFRNLMQLYQYDFSEYNNADPNPHGVFEYTYLDHYWTPAGKRDGRVPFLVRVNGHLAGFVLKNRWSYLDSPDTEHAVAEFFVMRKWRRRGIGRLVALELFRRFPSKWEVGEEHENTAAQGFWRAVINEYTKGNYREVDLESSSWHGPVQVFHSRAGQER